MMIWTIVGFVVFVSVAAIFAEIFYEVVASGD
jgi:hypothetical protein